MTPVVTKRCSVCGRFRAYDPDDVYCIVCGNDALESDCACGRAFEYALPETGDIHCPRCGRVLRGPPVISELQIPRLHSE